MLYKNQKDETLVMLTLAGEGQAYEALVLRHQRSVIAAAASVTRNQFMAEDASQDAFVTAWMKLDTLKEPEKFGAWVCKIAKFSAQNMVRRFRPFAPIEDVDQYGMIEDHDQNPAELYAVSEEKDELLKTILSLPEKVRQVIIHHYFDDLPIAEIAKRMGISEGTVKSQLHEGRKRLRKELSAMNEKANDTLVERVMKKVEELKLWQIKNDKSGFAAVYSDVLAEVENLPECKDKYHALADVLARGWWWLPGKKNDDLFARIKDAAMIGKNEEVMQFILTRENEKFYGNGRMEHIRDKQIPMLERAGFVGALAHQYYILAYFLYDAGNNDEALAACEKVREIASPADLHYSLASRMPARRERYEAKYKKMPKERFRISSWATELRSIGGEPHYFKIDADGDGYMNSIDRELHYIFKTHCDGKFFDTSLGVGEVYTATDGATLTFVSDNERVETPAGVFEGCQLWRTRYTETYSGINVYDRYFKEGVGIVKFEHKCAGATGCVLLSSYNISGGAGLLPLARGNKWEYTDTYNHDYLVTSNIFEVEYADGERTVIASEYEAERFGYDKESWLDAIEEIRNEYVVTDAKENQKVTDVYDAIARAEALAVTPIQKAHSKAACSVAKRILDTDPTFNPGTKVTGHWNFFERNAVIAKKGEIIAHRDHRWSFEWKNIGSDGKSDTPLLFNDIYGIIEDATKCLWSEAWVKDTAPLVEYMLWGSKPIKTQMTFEDGGTVTTKAGVFENCLKLSLNIEGMTDGITYRGGKKEYWFAEGVGIVKTANAYASGTKTAVYELVSYEGTGKGYMPFEDGLVRFYEAIGLTDGYYASSEYTYVRDDEDQIVIFENRTGIRNIPAPTTEYEFVEREVIEDRIWDEKKLPEARLRNAANNLHLMVHFMSRNSRSWKYAPRGVAWAKYRIKMIENMLTDEQGEIAPAWLGLYADMHFMAACTMFGCKKPELREEAYAHLERAFELAPRWFEIEEGSLLDVGDREVYGGIKIEKGEQGTFHLPDGTRECYDGAWIMNITTPDRYYYALTAKRGWEWFNSVREEERYKEFIARAREMMEKY